MRLPWRKRRSPEPDHARDDSGRLVDGDTVRPPGWPGWADALAARPADTWHGPTMLLPPVGGPLLTRGQRWRAEQSGWPGHDRR
jgi:hypothetical protein